MYQCSNKGNAYLAELLNQIGDQDISEEDVDEVMDCFSNYYYKKHYLKRNIVDHCAYVSVPEISHPAFQYCTLLFLLSSNSDFMKLVGLVHGTNSIDANYDNIVDLNEPTMEECIVTRQDLLELLSKYGISELDLKKAWKNGTGWVSDDAVPSLLAAGLDEKYIAFLKDVHYLPPRDRIAETADILLRICVAYLKRPLDYLRAYQRLHPHAFETLDYDDLVGGLSRCEDQESKDAYLLIIDMISRNVIETAK